MAVSPFKYTEADCAYQYLKLEKKIAAGADFAITQLGFDSRKFRELKRYLDERGWKTPIFGNVYVLPPKAAERIFQGRASRMLGFAGTAGANSRRSESSTTKEWPRDWNAPRRWRPFCAGLGYAGAYIGGTHNAEHIRGIIRRSEELAPRWEELAEEISYGEKGGFYLYEGSKPAPKKREWTQPILRHRSSPPTGRALFASRSRAFLRWVDHHPAAGQGAGRRGVRFQEAASSDARPAATAFWARWNTCAR